MLLKKRDTENKFYSLFNPETGFYMRTGILDENGKDTGIDPFMASYPELLDIGIMQTCVCAKKCNVDCYQKAIDRQGSNMSLEDFENILKQSKGKMFQCLHEDEVVLRNRNGVVGSVYIKDIRVGDKIFCGGNSFVEVEEKYEKIDTLYEINVGYGKRIKATKDHRFLTTSGLKTVGELSVGDELLSCKKNYNINTIDEIDLVKMIISSGYDDKFFLSDCKGMKEVCDTHGIVRNSKKTVLISNIKDYIDEIDYSDAKISRERSQFRFNTKYKITKEFMSLLGHYIGNGSHRTYVISKKQLKMIDAILTALKRTFPNFTFIVKERESTFVIEVNSTILHTELFDRILGCRNYINEKQLPNFIFSVSNEMKIAFLKGYFCDGNINITESDVKYGAIIFNTSSKKLYKDLTLLLSSIDVDYSVFIGNGGQSIFSKNDKRVINRKTRYRISIGNLLEIMKISDVVADHKDSEHFNEVALSEHNEKYLRERKGYIVKSIDKIDSERVVDINVKSDDHLFITTHSIISHNCALGGAGDVDTHQNFEEILKLCHSYNIVPNFTTSGIAMTKEKANICKKLCGAVAVSEHYAPYTNKALDMLLDSGVKTNIHYVLSNKSIEDAIVKLENDGFKDGVNAVVFLLYKPIGLGREENVLKANDPRVKRFFEAVDNFKGSCKIGFDSCSCAGIVNFTEKVNLDSIDFCEGGRFSAYIDANMNMMPCSFGNQNSKWFVSLRNHTIEEAWNSEVFKRFRYSLKHSCVGCKDRLCCGGGCPIVNQVTLCNRKERDWCHA